MTTENYKEIRRLALYICLTALPEEYNLEYTFHADHFTLTLYNFTNSVCDIRVSIEEDYETSYNRANAFVRVVENIIKL